MARPDTKLETTDTSLKNATRLPISAPTPVRTGLQSHLVLERGASRGEARSVANLDPDFYPLANFPTPPAFKKLCVDIDGIPTYVKDSTGTLVEDAAFDSTESLPRKRDPASSIASRGCSPASPPPNPSAFIAATAASHRLAHSHSLQPSFPLTPFPDEEIVDGDLAPMDLNLARSPSHVPPNLPSPKLSPKPDIAMPSLPLPFGSFHLPTVEDDSNSFDIAHPLADMDLAPPEALSRHPSLAELPHMIDTFDSLPPRLKSYVLLHLLRRCPIPTLQFVGNIIMPALKRDFFRLLPVELSYQIMLYLDLKSIGRCARVSKTWNRVVLGEDAEVTVWKSKLSREGWLKEEEVLSEIDKWKKRRVELKGKQPEGPWRPSMSLDDDDRMDEDSNPAAGRRFEDHDAMQLDSEGDPLLLAAPLHLYRNLYRKHHLIRRNWLQGRYRSLSFPAHGFNVVTCLQFDNEKIVSGSDDQTMNIYDVRTGELLRRLEGHDGGVWALQYTGYTLVSGSTDRTVRVWDLDTGKCTHVFEGHTSTVRCLAIVMPQFNKQLGKMEPEVPLVVTGSRDATLRVWRLPDPKTDPSYIGTSLDQASDAGDDEDGMPHSNSDDMGSHDGFGGENPYFMHVMAGHNQSVRAIAASGITLVSGSYDTTVCVWNLVTGQRVHKLEGHREKVYSVGYSDELKRAVSGSMDASVRIWDVLTGDCLHELTGHTSLVGLLELTPSYLVSAAADSSLRIWNPKSGECLAVLQGHGGAITCFHHDPSLNRVVSGSDGGVKLWELCSDPARMKYERSRADANEVEETEGDPMQYGRFQRDLLTNVQGVWRVRMDERRLVCAVQRDGARTYFEVLDFGAEVEDLDERPSDAPSDNDSDGDNHSGEDGEEDADASGSGSEEDDGDSGHKRRKPAVRSRNFEASQTRSRRNGSGSHARSGASWRQSNRPSGLSALQQTSAGSSSLGVESRRVETPTSSHGPDFPEQQ